MEIVFGVHLDGQRALRPADRLGVIHVGPLGFLNILETHLGLLAEPSSQATRIVQYRDCLARADHSDRFYHASFANDAIGTAETLLGWRDLWYLHGWTGGLLGVTSRRLNDMADVEATAKDVVFPSIGERLQRISVEMGARALPITAVRLVEPIEALPTRWQAVLSRLPAEPYSHSIGGGDGFLGQLQDNLVRAGANQPFEKLAWRDDGTVSIVQSETRMCAASWLGSQIDDTVPTLIVSGGDGSRLDAHISAAGVALQGFKEASVFRPAQQVLPLALDLLWDPLDFYALVQFLTHPVCPIPRYARGRLADKVADAPGIGGHRWNKVLEKIQQHYGPADAPGVRETIRTWVEHPRFTHDAGAPVDAVLERVRRLEEYFRARLGASDVARRIAFNAGFAQCRACAEALEVLLSQGVATIRPRQLQLLVKQATANGSDNPLVAAEVGACLAVSHPGAAIEPVDQVYWWQPTMPVLPARYPWSGAEIAALAQAGVELPSSEQRLAQAAQEWMRPILSARSRVTLVLPPEGEEVHPIWQMIEAVVDKPCVRDLEAVLSEGAEKAPPVDVKRLPARKRWWQLPPGIKVPLRQTESFSSLELLLFNPYHWLLKYPARLKPSGIVSLSGDFRLLGNIAHGLVERYFTDPDAGTMSAGELDGWFDRALNQLIAEEGALLRMAGRSADLERFRYRLRHAVQFLHDQVTQGGVGRVLPEFEVGGKFPGGDLSGFADLMMEMNDGGLSIVDMKWSGVNKFSKKLKENRHLQLAIYAELLRQMRGVRPSVAYFIIDRARIFSPDYRLLPDAEVVAPASEESTAQLWQKFVESWQWRKEQIASGAFEVALESVEETERSQPPENAMSSEYLNESYNDYRALAGWDQ